MAAEAVDPSSKFLEETLAGAPSPRRTFLDATVLEETYGLTRVFHAAEKHEAGPVLVKDQPWEGWGPYLYGTVLRDGDRFKLWYTCIGQDSGFVCYAESTNGLHWIKPPLGLYEFHGSTSNNIVARIVEPSVVPVRHPAIPDDSWALFYWAGDKGATAAFSADGLHWDWPHAKDKLFPTSDVVNFFFDPYHQRYTATYKTPSRRHRAVGIASSSDGVTWTKPIDGPVFTADDLDADATQVYGMPVFPYQGMYVGLPWIYHARFLKYGDYSVDRMNEAQMDSPRTVDVQMAWSWDLIHWTRTPERRPFLGLGEQGSWDDGMIFTARAPVVVGDELWFYYGGFDRVHDDYKGIQGAIGLATLRVDGFCSWQAGAEEGQACSRREVFLTPEIYINARTDCDGYVTAELLDVKDRVLPGFGRKECLRFEGDATDHLLHWQRREFSVKEARAVKKIRFYLRNADLFSYWPKELDTRLDRGNREPR
jgi:hypothetical protein